MPGHEIAEFHYHIPEKALMSVMENGKSVLLDGAYTLFAGGCQPDERSVELTGEAPLAIAFTVADGKNSDREGGRVRALCVPGPGRLRGPYHETEEIQP